MSFFTGTPGRNEQLSTLSPQQQQLFQQLLQAISGPGAGGAFGQAGDYYRNLLSDNPEDFNAFAAPELRRFREQTIPGLAEQFAGMGSGALSSSGFRNAAVGAGTDLSERLGALRAQLRQQGASGLMGLGGQGFQPTVENVYRQGQPGLVDAIGPALGGLAGSILGPIGTAAGTALGKAASNWLNPAKGSTSPYGEQ